jgi:hypothetical protein
VYTTWPAPVRRRPQRGMSRPAVGRGPILISAAAHCRAPGSPGKGRHRASQATSPHVCTKVVALLTEPAGPPKVFQWNPVESRSPCCGACVEVAKEGLARVVGARDHQPTSCASFEKHGGGFERLAEASCTARIGRRGTSGTGARSRSWGSWSGSSPGRSAAVPLVHGLTRRGPILAWLRLMNGP